MSYCWFLACIIHKYTGHQSLRLHHNSISVWFSIWLPAISWQFRLISHWRVTYGGRAFAVAGPSTWNSLPICLHNTSNCTFFSHLLKTFLFSQYWCMQHIRGFGKDALYKSTSCIALDCRSTTSGPGPSQICNSKCGPLLDLKLSVIYYHVASVCRYALCVCM